MKDICIVMARGGSKRVPRKNVRQLCGQPLVTWPVRSALRSGLFEHVIISTEDQEIASAAQQAGAEFPFVRPTAVADDFSTTADVLRVTLQQWQDYTGTLPKYCCCLYGTSVFVTEKQLAQAKDMLSSCELCMAVSEYAHPIQRAMTLDASGTVTYLHPKFIPVRTQDCLKAYHDIGLFYYFSVEAFFRHEGKNFLPMKEKAVVVPRICAVDIDSEADFAWAELLASYHGLRQ